MEPENNEIEKKTEAPPSLKKQMIIRVHQFLRDEYRFIKLHNIDNCTISPLAASITRTARATGVSTSYVSRTLSQYALRLSSQSNKKAKQIKGTDREPNDKKKRKRKKVALAVVNVIKNKPISDSSGGESATKQACLNNVFVIKQQPLDIAQETPVIKQAVSCIEQEILDIKQETLDIEEDISDIEQETPGINQEVPCIEQEILDIKQETLDIEEDISDIEQKTPGIKQEVPCIEQEILDIKQETLDIEEDISDIEQETPGIKQEVPCIEQEILDIKQETLDIKEDISDIEEDTSNVLQERQDIKQETNDKQKKISNEIDFENEININILLPNENVIYASSSKSDIEHDTHYILF
ncbi:uncharacterized protein PF3D7_1120000-like [Maniola hyperantus]|uniref:uncharacterized protein PF3D7_1120000-like n=1 Tax=Aphantopus hyperantus TaxID=2795564 RepID=UPI003747C94C